MNTIVIDSNIYKGAESYAKMHNISVTAAIEKAISMFLQKVQPKQRLLETEEFRDALSYVKTLKAKGGKPIPADENNLDALVDKKYAYSELLYNHKSAIFSKEKGIMAFPINSSSGLKTNSRAVIYKIDLENGFSLQGEIGTISNNYEEEVRRIVFVNGNYYTLSYSQVRVADMDSLNVFKIIDI